MIHRSILNVHEAQMYKLPEFWHDLDLRSSVTQFDSKQKHYLAGYCTDLSINDCMGLMGYAVKARRNTYGSHQSLPWGTSREL
jgi:hypothetical protein